MSTTVFLLPRCFAQAPLFSVPLSSFSLCCLSQYGILIIQTNVLSLTQRERQSVCVCALIEEPNRALLV